VVVTAATLCGAVSSAGAAAPGSVREEVDGSWTGVAPCVPASAVPAAARPTTLAFSCVTSSFWSGTWSGEARLRLRGALDAVSGDGVGTIDERFAGITAGGSAGRLHLLGTVVFRGASGTVSVKERIVSAAGGFAGAAGDAVFQGTYALSTGGEGSYHGWWGRPRAATGEREAG
jgi:hypothetical protein